MRRPVYGPGSFHDSAQCASLASYEAFNSLRFLADASGRRIEASSKYSELEHLGRLPLEDLKVQIACPGFQILDLNILVP